MRWLGIHWIVASFLMSAPAWAGIHKTGDYIDVSYNDAGTWNDYSGMGFRICGGTGYCTDASYPGSPWQVITIAYNIGGSSYNYTGNYSSRSWSWTTLSSSDISSGTTNSVEHIWDVGVLRITKTETWERDSKAMQVWFTVRNTSSSTVSSLRVMHGVDPDQDIGSGHHSSGSTYTTVNDTRADGEYSFSAGQYSDWTIGYGVCDPDTESLGHTGWSSDADATLGDYDFRSADDTIHWRHTEPSVGSGDTVDFGLSLIHISEPTRPY